MGTRPYVVVALVMFVLPGCSFGLDRDATDAHPPTPPGELRAVPPDEWKTVINDWYAYGRFPDRKYSCGAVRAAHNALPEDGYMPLRDDLRALERRVCR